MRAPFRWALALALAFVLAGCNTQNAEPPPKKKQAMATEDRPVQFRSPAELPPGHPPTKGLPPGHPPIDQGSTITGRLSLAPGLAEKAPPGAALFIIARRPGSKAPLAVARFLEVTFPFSYTIGPQNMMMPTESFEGEVEVLARLDSDGFIGPPQPGDLTGAYQNNPVSVGDSNVDFKLDKLP